MYRQFTPLDPRMPIHVRDATGLRCRARIDGDLLLGIHTESQTQLIALPHDLAILHTGVGKKDYSLPINQPFAAETRKFIFTCLIQVSKKMITCPADINIEPALSIT